jgi:hypothetical protein
MEVENIIVILTFSALSGIVTQGALIVNVKAIQQWDFIYICLLTIAMSICYLILILGIIYIIKHEKRNSLD